jgi:hypothetical protein
LSAVVAAKHSTNEFADIAAFMHPEFPAIGSPHKPALISALGIAHNAALIHPIIAAQPTAIV